VREPRITTTTKRRFDESVGALVMVQASKRRDRPRQNEAIIRMNVTLARRHDGPGVSQFALGGDAPT
jgi:hypothetical protein